MSKFKVDFTGVSEGGGSKVLPGGDYICKVTKIEPKLSGKGNRYLKWTFVVGVGPNKGSKIFHNTSLTPKALWNLRNTIIALGIEVPKSSFEIDLDEYVGKVIGVNLIETTYKNNEGVEKPTNEIVEMFIAQKSESGWGREKPKEIIDDKIEEVTNIEDEEDGIEL